MDDTAHGITTGAVARRLGVSPTTVRSWERRYGIGPAVRADGRHRRWSPADVAMLEEMCRLTASGVPPAEAARAAGKVRKAAETRTPAVPDGRAAAVRPPAGGAVAEPAAEPAPGPARSARAGSGLPLGDVRQECRGLARAAVRLDGALMEAMLGAALATYGLVTTWEEIMTPTLHAVGRKWESSGDRYVEVEHLLSWHVSTALRRAAVTGPSVASQGPPTLLACVPSEQHTLPLEALAAGLAEQALPTSMFGAAVPAEALDAAVRRSGPAAVVLWSQARSTADHALARHIAGTTFGMRGARTGPVVLLAGPGWRGRALAPGTARPGGLREAIGLISGLYGEPSAGNDGERAGGTGV
ncbi:MerR family transcriptional regulator [Streptomyces roseolus]|uniref:MerR family transcriptional regulator n=1 Tax=Streptomyces roseolus TaxID=67358 RepID=UPI0016742F54|nr:MerR family transcriptional regulator [Streptomyces roseolus]GGR55659.1 transcriptional regulator [Streptomyces roseolus]